MQEARSFTLSEIARRLEVPQHKLIHLCEKGVVLPEIHDAAGRGSSRIFSTDNFLELAVALRLRDMTLPVSVVGVIVHVLRQFGHELRRSQKDTSLADSLRDRKSPDLRVIVSDGKAIYFTLGASGKEPKLFGGIPLEQVAGGASAWNGPVRPVRSRKRGRPGTGEFGGIEGSEFARMELSVTAVARALPVD
jgi:DNA-binding transcriptional MerR regulator